MAWGQPPVTPVKPLRGSLRPICRLELGPEARGGREGAGGCCSWHNSPQIVNSRLWEKLPHPRGEAAECRRSGTEAELMRERIVGPHSENTVPFTNGSILHRICKGLRVNSVLLAKAKAPGGCEGEGVSLDRGWGSRACNQPCFYGNTWHFVLLH